MSEEMCPFCDEYCGKERADYLREYDATIPRWISVEDRLPEKLTEVLCFVKEAYGDVFVVCDYLADNSSSGDFRESDGEQYCRYKPTHWMLLPAAPK